jgi:putative transposase
MFSLLRLWMGAIVRLFRSRQGLLIENLALRQQSAVFKRQRRRPRLTRTDKLFWLLLHRFWSSWKTVVVVSPDTVVRWHRAGFHMYWRLISRVRKRIGRRPVTVEIHKLIFKTIAENPTWRAPRIHGELGDARLRSLRAQRRTITFGVLYCFFLIGHDRRRILHFNVTHHPTSAWIVQQLREAFPYEAPVKFLILDHDSKYGAEVPAAIRAMSLRAARTAVGCPWQNGVAERWVGSCRRELLDHVIAINESHLKRLLASYVGYYHQDRTHCGLQKQTPQTRTRCSGQGKVISWPRVGGLHHRYERAA